MPKATVTPTVIPPVEERYRMGETELYDWRENLGQLRVLISLGLHLQINIKRELRIIRHLIKSTAGKEMNRQLIREAIQGTKKHIKCFNL